MTDLLLDSKYVVRVRLMGPFAFDHIEQRYRDPEAVMRKIVTDPGDVILWPYQPEEGRPPPSPDDREEYELWARWQARQYIARRNLALRQRETAHFFLMEAIEVVRGPHPNIVNWAFRKFKLWRWLFSRTSDGFFFAGRYLHWLKTVVIASTEDWRRVQQAATAREVTMDGILDAARQFQREMGQVEPQRSIAVAERGATRL